MRHKRSSEAVSSESPPWLFLADDSNDWSIALESDRVVLDAFANSIEQFYVRSIAARYSIDFLPYSDDFVQIIDMATRDHPVGLKVLDKVFPCESAHSLTWRFLLRLRKASRLDRKRAGAEFKKPEMHFLTIGEQQLLIQSLGSDRSAVDRMPYTPLFRRLIDLSNAQRRAVGGEVLSEHAFWCALIRFAKRDARWKKPRQPYLFNGGAR